MEQHPRGEQLTGDRDHGCDLCLQMLRCISGMVDKTQRAISILQQRQAEAASVRLGQ